MVPQPLLARCKDTDLQWEEVQEKKNKNKNETKKPKLKENYDVFTLSFILSREGGGSACVCPYLCPRYCSWPADTSPIRY